MKAQILRILPAISLAIAMLTMLPVVAQTEQVSTQTSTTTNQSPAVDTLSHSLGSVGKNYIVHLWYQDERLALIAVTAIAVLIILFVALYAARTKKKD